MLSVLGYSPPLPSAIMWAILFVSFCMWVNLIQGYWRIHKLRTSSYITQLNSRLEEYSSLTKSETKSLFIGWQSEVKLYLKKGSLEVRLFIRLLPMLGLLGTVDGMIDCFANLNNSEVLNAISKGISQAMFTTLAGLLAALSGMYLAYNLNRRQQKMLLKLKYELDNYEN